MSQEFGRGAAFRERDLDLLADFIAGVLDDAQTAEVAHLVATDTQWARTYDALIWADGAVRHDLNAAAGDAPMPAAVAARLDRALLTARGATASRRPVVHSARRKETAGRRAWGRWAGVAAAAASVVAVVGGITVASQLAGRETPNAAAPQINSESGDRGAADVPPPSAPTSAVSGQPSFVISGIDYQAATLSQLALAAPVPAHGAAPTSDDASKVAEVPQLVREAAPAGLSRLTVLTELSACLAAIRVGHPGTVAVVDYARFGGQPALVVLVRQGATSTIVAVGPDCGLAGADEQASARIP